MAKVLVQLLGRLTNQVVWLGVKIGSRVCGWEGRWGREPGAQYWRRTPGISG